jgi:RNA polymerase sigma-70 factor (ECF subfamily)
VRASIDALRKLKREREFLEDFASHEEAVDYSEDDFLPEEYSVEAVKQAIGSLPGPYRLILTLVLIEGLDYEEISGFTGDNEGALRTRFSRARKMLVGRLKEKR